MAPWLFRSLLIGVVLFALWRGGRDERFVAGLCLVGSLLTYLLLRPIDARFQAIELGVLTVDLILLGGFVAVALKSRSFWPLWVAGLQLTTTLGHILKGVDANLIPEVYAVSLGFWSYPILLILAIGTWRSTRRRGREQERHAFPS